MKQIVIHESPDLDAVASVWFIRKYYPGWSDASVEFVPAGKTLGNMEPDSDANIIHADTGLGKFDHHQTSDFTCATKKLFENALEEGYLKDKEIEPLRRLVQVVTRYDHLKELLLKDADDDMHLFSIAYVIFGHRVNKRKVNELIDFGLYALDGILMNLKSEVASDKDLESAYTTKTHWGKTIVIESENDKAMKSALKKGFDICVRYSNRNKNVSIKLHPKSKKNLKKLYDKITPRDTEAFWFYHASGKILMNAPTMATRHKVTKYSLKEILHIIQSVK